VEDLPPTIDTAIHFGHDSSIRTPGLGRVREGLLNFTVWLSVRVGEKLDQEAPRKRRTLAE
jgi:hypothetical protein